MKGSIERYICGVSNCSERNACAVVIGASCDHDHVCRSVHTRISQRNRAGRRLVRGTGNADARHTIVSAGCAQTLTGDFTITLFSPLIGRRTAHRGIRSISDGVPDKVDGLPSPVGVLHLQSLFNGFLHGFVPLSEFLIHSLVLIINSGLVLCHRSPNRLQFSLLVLFDLAQNRRLSLDCPPVSICTYSVQKFR